MNEKKKLPTSFYSVNQLRFDYWNRLNSVTSELNRKNGSESEKEKSVNATRQFFDQIDGIEIYFTYPGMVRMHALWRSLERQEYTVLAHKVSEYTRCLVGDSPANNTIPIENRSGDNSSEDSPDYGSQMARRNHFVVLFVDDITQEEEHQLHKELYNIRSANDQFAYSALVVPSFQDAMIALIVNPKIQAVVIRYAPSFHSSKVTPVLKPYIQKVFGMDYSDREESELGPLLGKKIKSFRSEVDAYYITDTSLGHLKDSTIRVFRRIFYQMEDYQELHLTILRGIAERYETPFFSALKEYSRKPTGIFHAMPISRGNSVFKSRWILDFAEFYGRNLFLAETSATTGGLDSLLQPKGSIKKAQQMARQAYGAQNTYFVTNGTSTANKIVVQALVSPGDVVLIDRDCHKSHHYGMVLSGALPVYLDSYPMDQYSMYGAVPLEQIKEKLLELKKAGRLGKVKMLLLTNCTFDGLVYHVEKFMEEVLAIKPDMIFLWDEAWFAFAGFTFDYKQRTGMYVAKKLYEKYRSDSYWKKYKSYIDKLKKDEVPVMPDPEKVRIRVYSTQSTHKTLSSFRQGSMIHIWDEDFRRKSENTFMEAYMTHTSTSPNYQMLASLDVGRRQVQFEGYEMVEKSIELAMLLRARINDDPQLNKYFDVLTIGDIIPAEYRKTSLEEYYTTESGWNRLDDVWANDEFVLDPTKITLYIGRTGVDGDTFKNKYLMDKFNIQINKTSRNTVLFMTNIGTTRSSVTYLTNALLTISEELDEEFKAMNDKELEIRQRQIKALTEDLPPLPDFSYFHDSFQAVPGVPGGNIREAYFLSYDEKNYEYIDLEACIPAIKGGRSLVASTFVIPYPPGFPVLVPGQVVTEEIITFLLALDVSEIHGFRAELGLRIFRDGILNRQKTVTSIGMIPPSKKTKK